MFRVKQNFFVTFSRETQKITFFVHIALFVCKKNVFMYTKNRATIGRHGEILTKNLNQK